MEFFYNSFFERKGPPPETEVTQKLISDLDVYLNQREVEKSMFLVSYVKRLEKVLSCMPIAERVHFCDKLLEESAGPISACEKLTKKTDLTVVYVDCEFYTNIILMCFGVPRVSDQALLLDCTLQMIWAYLPLFFNLHPSEA